MYQILNISTHGFMDIGQRDWRMNKRTDGRFGSLPAQRQIIPQLIPHEYPNDSSDYKRAEYAHCTRRASSL